MRLFFALLLTALCLGVLGFFLSSVSFNGLELLAVLFVAAAVVRWVTLPEVDQ